MANDVNPFYLHHANNYSVHKFTNCARVTQLDCFYATLNAWNGVYCSRWSCGMVCLSVCLVEPQAIIMHNSTISKNYNFATYKQQEISLKTKYEEIMYWKAEILSLLLSSNAECSNLCLRSTYAECIKSVADILLSVGVLVLPYLHLL